MNILGDQLTINQVNFSHKYLSDACQFLTEFKNFSSQFEAANRKPFDMKICWQDFIAKLQIQQERKARECSSVSRILNNLT